jgi:hypothetical protein
MFRVASWCVLALTLVGSGGCADSRAPVDLVVGRYELDWSSVQGGGGFSLDAQRSLGCITSLEVMSNGTLRFTYCEFAYASPGGRVGPTNPVSGWGWWKLTGRDLVLALTSLTDGYSLEEPLVGICRFEEPCIYLEGFHCRGVLRKGS